MKKTEYRYSYEPVKKGVMWWQYAQIETLSNTNLEIDENQMTFEQWQEGAIKEKSCGMSHLENEFTQEEQYDELFLCYDTK